MLATLGVLGYPNLTCYSQIHNGYYKNNLQSTPDNSNLQGKLKKVQVIGNSSYRELRTNDWKYGKTTVFTVFLFIQCTF